MPVDFGYIIMIYPILFIMIIGYLYFYLVKTKRSNSVSSFLKHIKDCSGLHLFICSILQRLFKLGVGFEKFITITFCILGQFYFNIRLNSYAVMFFLRV